MYYGELENREYFLLAFGSHLLNASSNQDKKISREGTCSFDHAQIKQF